MRWVSGGNFSERVTIYVAPIALVFVPCLADPPPLLFVDFVRKMQLAMLRKFPEILAGKSARKF